MRCGTLCQSQAGHGKRKRLERADSVMRAIQKKNKAGSSQGQGIVVSLNSTFSIGRMESENSELSIRFPGVKRFWMR